LFGKRHNLT